MEPTTAELMVKLQEVSDRVDSIHTTVGVVLAMVALLALAELLKDRLERREDG